MWCIDFVPVTETPGLFDEEDPEQNQPRQLTLDRGVNLQRCRKGDVSSITCNVAEKHLLCYCLGDVLMLEFESADGVSAEVFEGVVAMVACKEHIHPLADVVDLQNDVDGWKEFMRSKWGEWEVEV
mmetsp:Transcript_120452/g.209710  ORF Transcript_120452/g.209710 Transcript_120452/m.209710 type:complete len:126 (-) Transcript_120452:349-726(-)